MMLFCFGNNSLCYFLCSYKLVGIYFLKIIFLYILILLTHPIGQDKQKAAILKKTPENQNLQHSRIFFPPPPNCAPGHFTSSACLVV